MVKKGTIGVRLTTAIGRKNYLAPFRVKGAIIRADRNMNGTFLPYLDKYLISSHRWRLATFEEMEAYNRGIRHIDDIVPVIYPIY